MRKSHQLYRLPYSNRMDNAVLPIVCSNHSVLESTAKRVTPFLYSYPYYESWWRSLSSTISMRLRGACFAPYADRFVVYICVFFVVLYTAVT